MSIEVTLRLAPAAARLLREGTYLGTSPSIDSIVRAARELGVSLRPLHESTNDPTLAVYFVAGAPDRQTAARLIEQLEQMPEVEAAYIKPPDEAP